MLTELNLTNFDEQTKNGLQLIEFFAIWCGYCKKQKAELELMDKIKIGLVDADKNTELAYRYNVNAFPTFLIFKNGKELERFSGYKSKEFLMNKLMQHL